MWLIIVTAGTKRSPSAGIVLAHSLQRWIALYRRWVEVYLVLLLDDGGYCSVDTTHWHNVDLVPGRRRRRWNGIESTLGLCLSFAG